MEAPCKGISASDPRTVAAPPPERKELLDVLPQRFGRHARLPASLRQHAPAAREPPARRPAARGLPVRRGAVPAALRTLQPRHLQLAARRHRARLEQAQRHRHRRRRRFDDGQQVPAHAARAAPRRARGPAHRSRPAALAPRQLPHRRPFPAVPIPPPAAARFADPRRSGSACTRAIRRARPAAPARRGQGRLRARPPAPRGRRACRRRTPRRRPPPRPLRPRRRPLRLGLTSRPDRPLEVERVPDDELV